MAGFPYSLLTSRSALDHTCNRTGCRVVQAASDLLGLFLAWHATIAIRLLLNPWMSAQLDQAKSEQLAPPLGVILLIWLPVVAWLGLYREPGKRYPSGSLVRAAEAALVSSTMMAAVGFFSWKLGAQLSRSLVLLFIPVSFLCLITTRYGTLLALALVETKWMAPESVAVLGSGVEAALIAERLRRAGNGSIRVAGVILPEGTSAEGLAKPLTVLGTSGRLAELINQKRLQRIIVVDGHASGPELDRCGRISRRMGVVITRAIAPQPSDVRVAITERYGLHLLELRPICFSRRQEMAKRIFDVVIALAALLLLWPVLLAVAILVKLTSAGPVLYKSPRVGRGGRYFTFLKFRSMYAGNGRGEIAANNEKNGHLFKIRNDPRVTPLGRFLRRYSVDELPQLFNVLRGEMSLVGPRPLPAEDLDPDGQSHEFTAWSEQRSLVFPGITGLWQVRGRSDTSFEQMMTLDIEYIRTWSLKMDLRILLETPLLVLAGQGAY